MISLYSVNSQWAHPNSPKVHQQFPPLLSSYSLPLRVHGETQEDARREKTMKYVIFLVVNDGHLVQFGVSYSEYQREQISCLSSFWYKSDIMSITNIGRTNF